MADILSQIAMLARQAPSYDKGTRQHTFILDRIAYLNGKLAAL